MRLDSIERLDTETAFLTILKALHGGKPLSVVRVGDGEARLLGYPDCLGRDELNRSLMYWFGRTDMPHDHVVHIRALLETAVKTADILGVATLEQQKRNPLHLLMSEIVEWLEPVGAIANCSLHRNLQEDGCLKQLLTSVDRVGLITCRNVSEAITNRYHTETTTWLVPAEANTDGEQNHQHYPDRFDEIMADAGLEHKGLWLVGAGPLGKIYCERLRERGSVAVDIGSVFDGWAGIVSRSYLRDREVYKL